MLSRQEYIARAADARIRSCGLDPEKVQEQLRADFVSDATVYLDAVGAYETYVAATKTHIALEHAKQTGGLEYVDYDPQPGDPLVWDGWTDLRAAISKAEGTDNNTEDQRG